MKQVVLVILAGCILPNFLAAQIGVYQQGTIVLMHMTDCMAERGFMAALGGGPPQQQTQELCPEYTLVSDKVVYVIVGKKSNELLPLAEHTDFRFQKSELAVRVDDAKHESRFRIREMVLRPEWEHKQQRLREEAGSDDHADSAMARRERTSGGGR
jgi:hypothetical protein